MSNRLTTSLSSSVSQLIASSCALWSLDKWLADVRQLRLLDTTCEIDPSAGGPRHGHVLWGSVSASRAAAIAWEWREVQPDVFAIADPMAVQSNIELVDDNGHRLHAGSRMVWLNRVIYLLPWQQAVLKRCRALVPAARVAPASRPPAVGWAGTSRPVTERRAWKPRHRART